MNFSEQVYVLVERIPHGRVATYGQIAALLHTPRAARMVGVALRSLPDGTVVPWHRVINSRGEISIENMEHPAEEQANRLMAEGIRVGTSNGVYLIDLDMYLWMPNTELTNGGESRTV
ncbi:MAG: methylated-DNA--[protein]-cysteine S-methyltransferase [Candidatus Komeilibacteria bacterium]|nr:methylated-DNA--[protein]-cysteine S-methyltransferase [Candidatus Komeilibacteria bacterium]